MAQTQPHAETWKSMVLRSAPAPAWLSADAPHSDVALSSRCRVMRNLRGFRFPHHATPDELLEISKRVIAAGQDYFDVYKRLSNAERDYLLGCRLISPDFNALEIGRAVLLDPSRECSV